MRRTPTFAVVALAAMCGWGCSGEEEANWKLVKVTGTVTKNGKPLADAVISFVPAGGNKQSTPGADQTGPEGNYMLTFKGRTGVAPGKYKVIVTQPLELPPGSVSSEPALADQPAMRQMALAASNPGKKKSAEAKKELAKSEFDREVEDTAGSVTLDFDVKLAN